MNMHTTQPQGTEFFSGRKEKKKKTRKTLVFFCSSLPFTKLSYSYSDLIFRKSVEFVEGFFWLFNRKRLGDGRARNPSPKKTTSKVRRKRGRKQTIGRALAVCHSGLVALTDWLVWMRTPGQH